MLLFVYNQKNPASSIRSYKLLTQSSSGPSLSPLRPPQWSTFWSLPLPLQARTIWYRLLHNRISCRSILHSRIPSEFPSPLCHICSTGEDTIDHFFFLCPPKLAVWLHILTSYINPLIRFVPSDVPHILRSIFRFQHTTSLRDPSLPLSDLSQEQVFACTLQGIWQIHWQS
ncbi:hypothetical protein A0J61_10752, partial [Choanephora cucurbitarum]